MKQTNIGQLMIRKQYLHIRISHYENDRLTTKDSELINERYQKKISEFIEEGADA